MSTPDQVAADMARLATTTGARVAAVVTNFGHLLHSAVKRNASEPRTNPRPSSSPEGPRLLTGDYNRSISLDVAKAAGHTVANVGTNKVQGPRLEMGFHGTDSAGRNYSQRPYPHFGPALDDVAPKFVAAVQAVSLPPKGVR